MRTMLALAAAALLVAPAAAHADAPPPGSKWTQAYITEADGTKLHADILRPANLPADAKTPVILSIGPYFNHSGQTGPVGPVEGTPYTPTGEAGPSARFYDFINGAQADGARLHVGAGRPARLRRLLRLPGLGRAGRAGRRQGRGRVGRHAAVVDRQGRHVRQVLRRRHRPRGIAQQPKGLAAVVSQEPVYDLYRYLYTNRVRFTNCLATPLLYDAIAGTPGHDGRHARLQRSTALDDPRRPAARR